MNSFLLPYWSIWTARFRELLQYRAAALAGFGTQLFWGLIKVMIFTAFYENSAADTSLSLEETVTYIWLGQALFMTLPMNVDRGIQAKINSGSVVCDLIRPVDLYFLWYCRGVALRTAPTLLRSIPMIFFAGLFLGMQGPASAGAFVGFLAAIVAAVLLSAALTTLMNVSLFWTLGGDGLRAAMGPCIWLFSGMIVPLPMFPDWARAILEQLPFYGLMDGPFRLFMGHLPLSEAGNLLLHQLAWTGLLVLLGRWLTVRGLRQLTVQGG